MRYAIFFLLIIIKFSAFSSIDSSEIYYQRALEHKANRQFDSALYYLNLCLEIDSSKDVYYFKRSVVREELSDIKGAVLDLDKAIEINPKPIYYNNRGIDMAILGDFHIAIQNYNNAISLDSNYKQAFYNRGFAHHYLKEYDQACEDIQKSYELGLNQAEVYLNKFCHEKD
jgi:tetratricopeptide (TPR) repeat protein